MFPLYKQTAYPSDKNATIIVRQIFGRVKVLVGGYDQSSHYIHKLWEDALRRVDQPAASVLLLGLGIGSALPVLQQAFPEAKVTAVEWDPVMIAIGRELGTIKNEEVIVGDAVDIVPTLDKKFDLIIVDLFRGATPEPRLASDQMLEGLRRALAPDGVLLLNFFKTYPLLSAFDRHFARVDVWQFQFNTLALYR